MKTAVTQLIEYMEAHFYLTDESRAKFDEAKEMEKDQKEHAYLSGSADNMNDEGDFKKYYNETYGGEQ